ncbi:hypothetical protein Drorol1_Dr00019611 [Drosera rotundifolia]
MATHFPASSPFILHKHNKLLFSYNISNSSRFSTITARSSADRIQEDDSSGSASSARTQLELLSQLTSAKESDERTVERRRSIKDQLEQLAGGREGDYSILLGKKNLKKVSVQFQTIAQKRNIKRQTYLNEVSRRNDSRFFATVGAFVLVPPIVILGIAIFTGYVQLFP